MNNPLFNLFGGQGQRNPILQRFQQFQQMFRGDPRQKVQEMLNSGRVSQAQYNQVVQMAQQLQKMIGIK